MNYLIHVPAEDIDQEIELLKLEGIPNPSRAIVYKRLSRGEMTFDEPPIGAVPLWSETELPDPQIAQTLIEWALSQEQSLREMVLDFLEEPSDGGVEEILDFMRANQMEIHKREAIRELTLTDIIKQLLSNSAREREELYEVARSFQPSQRPEAAVRQILRRLKKKGLINEEKNLISLRPSETNS